MLRHIDEENLPAYLGGKCTCSHVEFGCCPSPAKDKEFAAYLEEKAAVWEEANGARKGIREIDAPMDVKKSSYIETE